MANSEAPLEYQDPSLPPEQRARDLVSRMRLEEKVAQLGCAWCTSLIEDERFSPARAADVLAHGIGQVTRIGASTGLRPAQSAEFANAIQRFLVEETRLGIPAIVHEESVAGFTARDATQFPQAIGLASTWSPDLLEEMGHVIRVQMRAVGARLTLAPVLDIARDPRWGRVEETYGEDPYLAGRLGVAYVRGVQGDDLRQGVAATGKHFLGYGLSEGGLNHAPVHLGARELREVFARPFAEAIREAGLASVMNAYNSVDGLPCGGSAAILSDLLRGELGFEGVVVADYFTTSLLQSYHCVAADKEEAASMALAAGLDVDLPMLDCYGEPLRSAVAGGRVPESLVDRALCRVLEQKFALGLFEAPYVDADAAPTVYDTLEQRELARELGRRSLVLLENDGLLPLDPDVGEIAVIGPSADDVRLLQGDYSYPTHLEIIYKSGRPDGEIAPRPDEGGFAPGPDFVPTVTLLEGIRNAVSRETRIRVARGCEITGDDRSGFEEAVAAARASEVAVICVGGKSGLFMDCTSGEFRDATDLDLTGVQEQLVEAIAETGTPVVVVVVSGRVHSLERVAARAGALLLAWLPGEEGGNALADILFGGQSPSGHLPVSLPRHVGQVPVYYNHRSGGGRSQMFGDYSDRSPSPLFPFGHGLTYTEVRYSELTLDGSSIDLDADAVVEIGCCVENVGGRACDEVVQLYLRDVVASVARPVLQLAGFARVHLSAGQARRVTFRLALAQLAFYDAEMRFVVEPGRVEISVGSSSAELPLQAAFDIVGKPREFALADQVPTAVEVR